MGLIRPLYDAAVAHGVRIITGMRAQELVLDHGKVVGVKATDKTGNKYEFKSVNGVILATGGYSQNKVLRQKSAPHLTPDMVSATMHRPPDSRYPTPESRDPASNATYPTRFQRTCE